MGGYLFDSPRRIGGDDYPNIHLAVAQGTLPWQPVKFVDVRTRRQERPLLFASVFDKGLADRKSAFKTLNGNNSATLCTNLVNFHPTVSEFTLLKCAIFAAIRPQFGVDLQSSPWHSETDWKIAILILAE